MLSTENLITIAGGIVATGAVYGRFQAKISQLQKQVDTLNNNHNTIIEVKTKIDFIIDYFLNNKNDKK